MYPQTSKNFNALTPNFGPVMFRINGPFRQKNLNSIFGFSISDQDLITFRKMRITKILQQNPVEIAVLPRSKF